MARCHLRAACRSQKILDTARREQYQHTCSCSSEPPSPAVATTSTSGSLARAASVGATNRPKLWLATVPCVTSTTLRVPSNSCAQGGSGAWFVSGYQLFKSLGCISCHQGVNVGGNLSQRHGIFHPVGSAEPALVRVPSLRNVATTPPYFHDGSTPTLSEAVKKMGIAQLDRVLTDQQIAAIIAFLNTLTGTYRGQAVGPATATPGAATALP